MLKAWHIVAMSFIMYEFVFYLRGVTTINYLLTLFAEKPRHYRVIEGILRGRRTVAILFWGQQYGILDWLRAAPHLTREHFDQQLKTYAKQGLLVVDAQQATAKLSQQGRAKVRDFKRQHYWPHYGRWSWTGDNPLLPLRLWLGVQAVSQLAHHHYRYVPITNSPSELGVVHAWLKQPLEQLCHGVYQEVFNWGNELARTDMRLATLLVYQLPGFGQIGWTDQDALQRLEVLPMELPVMQRDLWAGVGRMILQDDGPLAHLCRSLVPASPLNFTTSQTLKLFQQGITVETIAKRRRLKVSTIREHLLQAAILVPGCVNLQQLLGEKLIQQLSHQYAGPVDHWRFQAVSGQDNAAAFFEFRAYQILKSGEERV